MKLYEVIDRRQGELFDIPASVDVQRNKELLTKSLLNTKWFSKYADNKYAQNLVLADVSSFFSGMWHNQKGLTSLTELGKYQAIAELFPYTGPCFRIMGVSLDAFATELPPVRNKYPNLLRMLDKYDAKDAAAKEEFYQYLSTDVSFKAMDSWAKTMEGINYFHELKTFHTRNVIYKGMMHGGLDFVAFANALVDCGLLSDTDKKVISTRGAEEVIGYCHRPIPIKWRMVKKMSRAATNPYDLI